MSYVLLFCLISCRSKLAARSGTLGVPCSSLGGGLVGLSRQLAAECLYLCCLRRLRLSSLFGIALCDGPNILGTRTSCLGLSTRRGDLRLKLFFHQLQGSHHGRCLVLCFARLRLSLCQLVTLFVGLSLDSVHGFSSGEHGRLQHLNHWRVDASQSPVGWKLLLSPHPTEREAPKARDLGLTGAAECTTKDAKSFQKT